MGMVSDSLLFGHCYFICLHWLCQEKCLLFDICLPNKVHCNEAMYLKVAVKSMTHKSMKFAFVWKIFRQISQHFFNSSISFLCLLFQTIILKVEKACCWTLMLNMRMRWRNDRWFIWNHWQISNPLNSSFKYFFNLQSKRTRVNWCFY